MNLTKCKIQIAYLHHVGNKSRDEQIIFSERALSMSDEIELLVNQYFLSPFKLDEYQRFAHDSDLGLNEAYNYVSKIFADGVHIREESANLAKHLYKNSTHPNIKGGEFYTVYFRNCLVGGDFIDAIGLFKSENKDTFLKVEREEQHFNIHSEQGININNLDKGCLIFNIDAEDGYWVAVVDKSGKGSEAQYWKDDFLGLKPKTDEFSHTQNFMNTCKTFVTKDLAEKGASQIEQAELLSKSLNYFKEHKQFDSEQFSKEIFEGKRNLAHLFEQYKNEEEDKMDVSIPTKFGISDIAVKKQVRSYKKVIHLDASVDIHLLNDEHNIEQGEDDKGRFYKIYFNNEK